MREPPKTKKQSLAEAAEEARALLLCVELEYESAGDLVLLSASKAQNRMEEHFVRSDLLRIATRLARGDSAGYAQTWEHYKRHFLSTARRDLFFVKLNAMTRDIASARLGADEDEPQAGGGYLARWDSTLLPKSVAPYVLRVAILHPGILEHFLPRYFIRTSDASRENSTYMRAVRILVYVPTLGWSCRKHAAALRKLGDLRNVPRKTGEQTVKRFITRLRKRHRFMSGILIEAERRQIAESKQGTS